MVGSDHSRRGQSVETIQVFDILTAVCGIWCHVVGLVGTDVSGELPASIIKVEFTPFVFNKDTRVLRNVHI